jgi:RimJ/RimL family protein N-acetyltransferase
MLYVRTDPERRPRSPGARRRGDAPGVRRLVRQPRDHAISDAALPAVAGDGAEWFDRTARSAEDIVWAVFAGERLIGTTGIHRIDWPNRRALTGNLIGEKTEWNKGYGSEVVRLRTRFAFTEMGLEKLTTKVFTENVGSRRALEKAGYRQCGLARRDEWRHGKWHDMWLAEVLRDEWASGAAAAAG